MSPPVTPSRATDPSRSARLRPKPADADPDADADLGRGTSRSARLQPKPAHADADLGRGAPRSRGKRQRKAAAGTRGRGSVATDDDGQPVGAGVADADAEQERGASRSRGKRQRKAAGKASAGARGRGSAAREAPRMMEADGAISDDICADEPDAEELRMGEEEEASDGVAAGGGGDGPGAGKKRVARPSAKRTSKASTPDHFVGEPIPDGEARQRWPERYAAKVAKGSDSKAKRSDAEEEIRALRHYTTVCVDQANFHLGDDVYVKAAPGVENYIGRITELFEGSDHGSHFTCRWFFRVEDTVISPSLLEVNDHKHDPKRVFLSEEKNDNVIESIISKVNIIYVGPNMTPKAKAQLISKCDLYYDMSYSVAYSTFANMPPEYGGAMGSEADVDSSKKKPIADIVAPADEQMETATLLDLYSGCGAMSTGLCLGAAWSGLKLNTKWAVDVNTDACNSLKHNHTGTQVRNEKAEDFLSLLQHWDGLCKKYDVHNSNSLPQSSNNDEDDENENLPEGTFEVEKLVDICYGDPNSIGQAGLWFKVRWKTYDASYDSWEPSDGLSDSPERIKEFVESGYRESILPLPGCVDVICGGPPCQGISGLNRFRNYEHPLTDERNKQLVVFMDIVNYLRPKYVLMENVVDILKFADGLLGRYALSRLVAMSYQARLGLMVAGSYGLPQFRMRAFLWGALPSVVLPKFPLPTHDVINRGVVPNAFSQCLVAYNENEDKHLKEALVIRDAISDLPKVGNHQPNDVMDHCIGPKTKFQQYIRLNRKDMKDYSLGDATPKEGQLFDHQPLQLNNDDYERVQQIPVKKVPSYAMTFIKGKSLKPFGRLWWDETVATVVTRAEPHNQIVLHPTQNRVLTIRENARLQGFPDYYRLLGPIKQKYIQVGNAVAVPVARALGYSLGQAYQGEFDGDYPLFKLPGNFIPMDQATLTRLSEGTSRGEVEEAE